MSLSDILLSNVTRLDEVEKLIDAYEFGDKSIKSIYKEYHHNVESFKNILNSLIHELTCNRQDLPEQIKLDIFRNICIRLEQVETQIYTGLYSNDLSNQLDTIMASSVRELAETYVELLCTQYSSLSDNLKVEATKFYDYKCDIIETFIQLCDNQTGGELACAR